MATRYDQGRKRWVVEFEQAGVRVFRRLPQGATESQGKALETKLRREIFDRETLQKIPALTLERAIEQWLAEDHRRKDRKKMASEAKQWAAFAKGKLLRDVPEVAQEAICEWTGSSRDKTGSAQSVAVRAYERTEHTHTTGGTNTGNHTKIEPSTINRRLAMLKAVCRHAYKQGRIAENLSGRITMLREDNRRERYLTVSEVQRLIAHSPSSDCAAAITLLAYTGLRTGELLSSASVDRRSHTLSVEKSKTGKPRLVPVPRGAWDSLRSMPFQLSYWQLRKQFIQACKKAGIKGIRLHDLRHTTASWLINKNVDLYTVGKILGHSGPQTTARYAHLAHATLKDAMGRLK